MVHPVDVIFERIDFREGREAAKLDSLPLRHDGGRRERMIEEAAVRVARLDRARGRGVEVAETWIGPIDVRQRLAQLGAKIRRGEVELAAGDLKQHLPPSERRQTPARVGDPVDQGRRVGR